MVYRRLFILVEGDDDERFFQRIIKSKIEEKYNSINLWKYAQKSDNERHNLLKSIKAIGADYIYVADINRSPCATHKKQEIESNFKNIENDKIIVVIKEIESWYLAGLDTTSSPNFKIPDYGNTDNITKEDFNRLIPKKFDSKIDFMLELLKLFSIEIARQKNKSFRYFLERHICKANNSR